MPTPFTVIWQADSHTMICHRTARERLRRPLRFDCLRFWTTRHRQPVDSVTGSGRYTRMYGTARATAYGYSLRHIAVAVQGLVHCLGRARDFKILASG
jgi:hypothetical protein